MSNTLSESSIVRVVAQEAAQHIMRKVIAELQQMKDTMYGDDSELKTTWDEVCVQVQSEKSVLWDAYDQTVRSIVGRYVGELPHHEREAIWLQTDAGTNWDCEDPEDRDAYPVGDDDIVDYLTSEYVYTAAERWSNACIRAYIEQSSRRD